MPRRLKPLGLGHLERLPSECASCVFWESSQALEVRCGVRCDADRLREWHRAVSVQWGDPGRVALEDDQVMGFIKYAPPEYFPQALHLPGEVTRERSVLIACMHIHDDARRHGLGSLLLKAALRDVSMHGEKTVYAYACPRATDMTVEPMIGMDFLLRNGFAIAHPHPAYPLLKLDMRSLVQWTENLEAVLESLRIPWTARNRLPSPSVDVRGGRR